MAGNTSSDGKAITKSIACLTKYYLGHTVQVSGGRDRQCRLGERARKQDLPTLLLSVDSSLLTSRLID